MWTLGPRRSDDGHSWCRKTLLTWSWAGAEDGTTNHFQGSGHKVVAHRGFFPNPIPSKSPIDQMDITTNLVFRIEIWCLSSVCLVRYRKQQIELKLKLIWTNTPQPLPLQQNYYITFQAPSCFFPSLSGRITGRKGYFRPSCSSHWLETHWVGKQKKGRAGFEPHSKSPSMLHINISSSQLLFPKS